MLNHDAQLDRMFQALADANRRALIAALSDGPASVSDLAAPLPISLPAVLQHLAVLEESGLVRSEKRGRVRTCMLNGDGVTLAETWLGDRRRLWERRLDALGDFLNRTEEKDR